VGKERHKCRQGKLQRQVEKGANAGKGRYYKSRQGKNGRVEKVKRQAREATYAGKERHKGRQRKLQWKAR
jgi:hypothetical protein